MGWQKEKVCENQTIPRAVLEHATSSVSVWRIAVKAVKMVWENQISQASLIETYADVMLIRWYDVAGGADWLLPGTDLHRHAVRVREQQ